MNKSLEMMRQDMAKQTEAMQKELNLLEGIKENTGSFVEVVKTFLPGGGVRTTIGPPASGPSDAWTEDELRAEVARALG
jgi:hypothetical protein